MIRRLRLLAISVTLLACAPSATPAGTVAAPDSAQRAALQARIGRLRDVQIIGPAGATRLLAPVVREDGLHMRRPWKPPRAALFVSADAPQPPRPAEFVPWSAIGEVQVRRGRTVTGALTGAAFGAGLSALLLAVYHEQAQASRDQAVPVILAGSVILVGGGAAAGALLGSFDEGWRTVYPAPAAVRP